MALNQRDLSIFTKSWSPKECLKEPINLPVFSRRQALERFQQSGDRPDHRVDKAALSRVALN